MFRMWSKLWKENHLLKDTVITNSDYSLSRTQMVFKAVEETCLAFDLGHPIWLDTNIKDFQRHSKARFYQDSFVEMIEFDYLEIQVLEE